MKVSYNSQHITLTHTSAVARLQQVQSHLQSLASNATPAFEAELAQLCGRLTAHTMRLLPAAQGTIHTLSLTCVMSHN